MKSLRTVLRIKHKQHRQRLGFLQMLKLVGNFMHMGIGSKLTEASQLCSPSHVAIYRIRSQVLSILCQGFVNW